MLETSQFVKLSHYTVFKIKQPIAFEAGMKMGRMAQTFWIIWVTFYGLSRSHPQTELSGCDPGFQCVRWLVSVKQTNFEGKSYAESTIFNMKQG